MSPEHWQKLSTTLDRVLELPRTEQLEFLGTLRRGDPEFCAEVESLLAEQDSHDLFEAPPAKLMEELTPILEGGSAPVHADTEPLYRSADGAPIQMAGRYQIQGEIARGGMGALFRVRDPEIDRILAVKILLPEARAIPDAERRFLQEARITGRLQHPGIPPVHELGRLENDVPFFAMKLIEGKTLTELIRQQNFTNTDPRWVGVFEQICRTLAYAHSQGIIHRDLKPSNVMVGAFGEVQVMDWGLAKSTCFPKETRASTLVDDCLGEMSQAGSVIGTPAYMAPEQARGETDGLDERCDVFGLGGILCALLTGAPPFQATGSLAQVRMAAQGELAPAFEALDHAAVDCDLVAIARKCLAPNKEERYQNAGDVAEAVTAYRESVQEKLRQAELAREKAQVQASEERRRRRLAVTLAISVLVLIVGIAGAGLWYQQYQNARQARARHLNEQVTKSLDEADSEQQQLQKRLADRHQGQRLLSDLDAWTRSLSSARVPWRQAEKLADADPDLLDGDLRERLRILDERLDADAKDEKFAHLLDSIRMDYFNLKGKGAVLDQNDPNETRTRAQVLSARFADAFASKGWRVNEENAATLAARIQAAPTRHTATAALDSWAWMAIAQQRPDDMLVKRLLELARRVDPDSWRDRFRQWDVWSSPVKVQALVSEVKFNEQPPPIVTAVASLQRQHGIDSLAVLRAALIHHPADFWLNADLAYVLLQRNAEESIIAYRAALLLRPSNTVVLNNLGTALMVTRNDHDSARLYFRKALGLEPKHLYAHCNLAKSFYLCNELTASIDTYQKALAIEPNDPGIHNDLAVSLVLAGDVQAAVKHASTAARTKANYPLAHHNLAVILRDAGKYTDALREMRRAHELEPSKTRELFIREFEWTVQTSEREMQPPLDRKDLETGISGQLTDTHPFDFFRRANCYRASYAVPLKAKQSYQLDLTGDFDTLLRVEDDRYKPLLFNDDLRDYPKRIVASRLIFTPPRDGVYRLVVTSFEPLTTGKYTLKLASVVPDGPPTILRGSLTQANSNAKGKLYQTHTIELTGDQPATVVLESQDFDTFVGVLDASGKKYLGWNTSMTHENLRHSRVDLTPAENGRYRVYVSSAQPDKTGSYLVTIQRYGRPLGTLRRADRVGIVSRLS